MTKRKTEFFQIVIRNMRQGVQINRVVGERGRILANETCARV
jgi:hypothetical protein